MRQRGVAMKMSPRIISYDISEGTVFFNTKTNDSFLITNELIKKVDEDEETEKQYESYLEQHNYFLEEDEVDKYLTQISEADKERLGLTVLTHGDCNFRCKYCYEHFTNISMSLETENAIFYFVEEKIKTGQFKYLTVAWFGGEPLLGFKTIVSLGKRLISLCNKYNVNYDSSLTTNGFLLDKKKFVTLVTDLRVTSYQITLDGNQESHDRQRISRTGKGTYDRILKNLIDMRQTKLDFECIIRFNITKENYPNICSFLKRDGLIFKEDERFLLFYCNVGDWGKGDRVENSLTLVNRSTAFELSKRAVKEGYSLFASRYNTSHFFSCYANKKNHYAFNVNGIVQSCTVALYDKKNIFGNINTGFVNQNKIDKWVINVDDSCSDCPYLLICKSGNCPMVKRINGVSFKRICESMKNTIYENLALFALDGQYNDILDVE